MSKAPANHSIFLRDIDIFQDLTEAEVDALGEKMPHKEVPAKTVFYTPQDKGEVLFMLKKGRVRLFHLSADGKTLTTAIIEAGTFFGEMALLGQRLHCNYAEAVTDCTICPISHENAKKYFIGDERIAYRIIETLGKRLLQMEERMANVTLKQVPARVAALLLQFAEKQITPPTASTESTRRPIEISCTHVELAQMLGIHRETMTRTLKEFSRLNLIELGRGSVRLLDTAGLLDLSAV